MFRKKIKTGFDLGQNSVKYSLVERELGIIHNLWKAELMPERKSRDEKLEGEKLVRKLKELFRNCQKEMPDYTNQVNTVIQGEGIISRYIELPVVKEEELELAIPSQAIKYIPFPMDQVNLTHIKVPAIVPEKDKTGIFFSAAKKSAVKDMKKLLEECGLEVERMEPPVFALLREFSRNHNLPSDRFYGVVHSGFHLTHVVIIRDRYPYYSRDFAFAGRDFTYAFQMGSQISWEEAEKQKLDYDTGKKAFVVEPFLIQWLNEVQQSLEFFGKQFRENFPGVEKVFLSGGTGCWKGLDKRLSEHLKIPVELDLWDVVKNDSSMKENAPLYKIAVGITLKN